MQGKKDLITVSMWLSMDCEVLRVKKGVKFAQYRAEREKGLTYRTIAEKYGVSYQSVAQACGKGNPHLFRYHTAKSVIYPNLRKWLNDNKISKQELLRRAGLEVLSENDKRLSDILSGRTEPRKTTIDRLIKATGMSYEKLFEEVWL